MSLEEKESSMEDKSDEFPQKVKKFVIVKEYNGYQNLPKKTTKREYTEKTITKEKLSKSERNSLENLFSERSLQKSDSTDRLDNGEEEKKDDIKFVTFLSPSDESSNESQNDSHEIKQPSTGNIIITHGSGSGSTTTTSSTTTASSTTPASRRTTASSTTTTSSTTTASSTTTMDNIQKGAIYSLLTAGGLIGAYAIFKTVAVFDNN